MTTTTTKMRVAMVAVGSRGDAEPFISLTASMIKAGHDVDLFLQHDLVHLAPSSSTSDVENEDNVGAGKVVVHTLPFGQADFYQFVGAPSHGADHPNPRVQFIGTVTDIIAGLVLPCLDQVRNEITTAAVDAIVVSSLARQLGMLLALDRNDNKKIPLYLVQLQPLVPNNIFPHYSNIDESVQAIVKHHRAGFGSEGSSKQEEGDGKSNNDDADVSSSPSDFMESYLELERFQYDFLKDRLPSNNYFPTFEETTEMLMGTSPQEVYMVNACSSLIFPTVNKPRVLNVGPLADSYIPTAWSPPQDLVDFLNKHNNTNNDDDSQKTKPVCIGFGSMPFGQIQLVLEALEVVQRPAVLVGGCMEQIPESDRERLQLYCTTSAPYPWLLPQCHSMTSHGGAGVFHATLKAGIPNLICPLMGDQFSHAKLVQEMNLGVQVCEHLTQLTAQELASAILQVDENKGLLAKNCQEMGQKIASTHHCQGPLVRILEEHHLHH